MAYDEVLAGDIRDLLRDHPGLIEKKMFGGVGFMIHGHMAVAANSGGGMMVRVDPATVEDLLDPPAVDLFDMGGRTMAGWLKVTEPGDTLSAWVQRGVDYTESLPPK